jgi:stage V sporulation protein S
MSTVVETLKVGANTEPAKLAGAISGLVRKNGLAEVQAIGAGAVNQLVKAVAISRGFFASQDQDLCMFPSFMDTEIDGDVRTVIRVRVHAVPRQ